MVSANKKEQLIKALESPESFFALLDQERRAEEHNRLRLAAKEEIHPSGSMLYDLFNGTLDEARADNIQNHLFYCRRCSDEFARIMRIENELEAEAMEWIEKSGDGDLFAILASILSPISIWKEQFSSDGIKPTPKEFQLKSGTNIGYREGEYVILLEDSDKNSEVMKKDVRAITELLETGTLPDIYKGYVLVQNENGQWEIFDEIDQLERDETDKPERPVKIKVKDEKHLYDKFVLILDMETDIKNSSEIIMNLLNGEKPEEKPSETAVVIVVEVAETQEGEE